MDHFEQAAIMTDAEANEATLQDMSKNMGQYAVFIEMLQRGDEYEV